MALESQVELEFENFRREDEVLGEKILGARIRNNTEQSQLTYEPGPQWWEASTLTTAPSPLPRDTCMNHSQRELCFKNRALQ